MPRSDKVTLALIAVGVVLLLWIGIDSDPLQDLQTLLAELRVVLAS